MSLFPQCEPYASGRIDVGDGNRMYWETCGNPSGLPVGVLHGGPGSGCTEWHRRLFDPAAYRIVLFDQRNCGRSLPHASDPKTSLGANTTWHLVRDIEVLRTHLEIERWLICGGSWGSVLALAYATSHPERVTQMILFGVATGRHEEIDWLFRGGLSKLFPEEWHRLSSSIPAELASGDVVEIYCRLLSDPDPAVRQRAAQEWCLWESATPDWPPTRELALRFKDPAYATAFARIVTYFVSHNLWLDTEGLLPKIAAISHIPGVLINGRFDLQSPRGNAWTLHRLWSGSKPDIVPEAGHRANEAIADAIVRAGDEFARNHGHSS